MKSLATSAVLSIAALSWCSLAVVPMNISKNPAPGFKLSRRVLAARDEFSAVLDHEVNNILTSNYIINVKVGSPPQDIAMAIDTGSSDVWVLDTSVAMCATKKSASSRITCRTPFSHEDSTTFNITHRDAFDITYGDGSSAQGDYFTDDIKLGGQTVKAQTMGIAYNSTLSPGLLGIGYTMNEASASQKSGFTYPSIIDNLLAQDLISTKAYSLYLDDLNASSGSLLFGGLDSDKYQGNLVQMPIIPRATTYSGKNIYTAFNVDMVSFGVGGGSRKSTKLTNSTFDIEVNLDSGTTLSFLPLDLYDDILVSLEGEEDVDTGFSFVDCAIRDDNEDFTFDFEFGVNETIVIKVPAAELIYDMEPIFESYKPDVDIKNPCLLGFVPSLRGPYILGDNFLRSAYVVYDLKNNLIALGQTNFDSTTSTLIDFPADATSIPMKSGVASTTRRATTTTGGVATTTGIDDEKNPAVAPRPLDLGGLAVLGISMLFTLVGGGLFLVY